ncbi:hypothetical protein EV176_006948, partial [Coemansia sp. RSA 451]
RWYSQYPKLDDIAAEDIAAVRRFREKFTRDAIPHKNFTTTFHRSGGAGGQNVNKVSTKVYMRFTLAEQSWIPAYVQQRMRDIDSSRINSRGEYLVVSEKTRTQRQNIEDCLDKLWQHIDRASTLPRGPSAETTQRVEKLRKAEKARNMETKKRHSQRKAGRRRGSGKMAGRRVVVTGLGMVSPVGVGVKHAWNNILAGRSGIQSLVAAMPDAGFDAQPSQVAGIVPRTGTYSDGQFDAQEWLAPGDTSRMAPFTQFATCAAQQALDDA